MSLVFKKILVANRGEIACRIIRTAHDMGVKVVAIYSDSDKHAKHVRMADEAVHVGQSPSAQSYLLIDKIIEVAKQTSSQAIHPGYGFLSENAEFVRAVEAAGIVFIGPDAHAMEMMGDKITSKKLAEEAGVSIVPGSKGAVTDISEAQAESARIGYPVMIKASSGGGGKGMRVVGDEAELQSAMQAAMNEARSSFGDDRVFIEKFVQQPRHIEIQILADTHGNIIFLGERECSIQRRHQKVIEEAPSCLLSQKTRQAMGQQAIALARAVNYRSAGTVEFIVGADEDFYFLEMNTRLQVEHPVTELVHDVDLVSLMIKLAAGERLELTQEEVKAHGWAVEARIYAEDSTRGFLPSIGQLRRYVEPEIEAIRIDSGVVEGSHIAMFYDPMIAKIIAYGKDRQTAISELSHALDRYQINGVETNIQFLNAILSDKDFIAGDITTAFIDEKFDGKFVPLEPVGEMRTLLIALAAGIMPQFVKQKNSEQQGKSSYLLLVQDEEDYLFDWQMVEGDAVVTIDEAQYTISGSVHKSMSIFTGSIFTGSISSGNSVTGDMSEHQLAVKIERDYHHLRLTTASFQLRARLLPAIAQNVIEYMPEQSALSGLLKVSAPMPGLLTKLLVSEGDTLFSGQEVAIMEAMKMENSLRCEIDCVVGVIHASEGDLLNVDDLIITLKEK